MPTNTLKELFSRQGFRDMRDSLKDNLINAGQGIVDGSTAVATAPAMLANAIGQRFVKDPNKRRAISSRYNNYINRLTSLNNTVNQYWDERKAADGRDWSSNNTAANVARMTAGILPSAIVGKSVGSAVGSAAKAAAGGPTAAEVIGRILAGGHPLSYGPAAMQAAPDAVRWIGRIVKGVDPHKTEQIASNAQAARSNPIYNAVSKATLPGFLYSNLREGLGRSHAQHMMYLLGRPHAYNNRQWYEPKLNEIPEVVNNLDNLYRNNPKMAEFGRGFVKGIGAFPQNKPQGVQVDVAAPGSFIQPFTKMNWKENSRAFARMLPSLKKAWNEAETRNSQNTTQPMDSQAPTNPADMKESLDQLRDPTVAKHARRIWTYRDRPRKASPNRMKSS